MPSIAIKRDGPIATVTIANPGKRNAIASSMWTALRQSFLQLSQEDDLRCVILRGEGADFAAGADIHEFPQVRATTEQAIHYHANLISPALQAVAQCTHPTVAAIEGICVGGGLELACACDIRIASPAARFGIPINLRGFPLAPGEMQELLNLVGKATVLEILLEGRIFDSAEAKEKGLVHRIDSDVPTHAWETAQRIAAGAPLAARMNKALVRRLAPATEALSEGEIHDAFSYMSSADYREGVQSFIQKRKPTFTGK
jgi:enoyl-CoA hydratase